MGRAQWWWLVVYQYNAVVKCMQPLGTNSAQSHVNLYCWCVLQQTMWPLPPPHWYTTNLYIGHLPSYSYYINTSCYEICKWGGAMVTLFVVVHTSAVHVNVIPCRGWACGHCMNVTTALNWLSPITNTEHIPSIGTMIWLLSAGHCSLDAMCNVVVMSH